MGDEKDPAQLSLGLVNYINGYAHACMDNGMHIQPEVLVDLIEATIRRIPH